MKETKRFLNDRWEIMSPEEQAERKEMMNELTNICTLVEQIREEAAAKRVNAIVHAWKMGARQSDIARATKLTSGRISQIISDYMRNVKVS